MALIRARFRLNVMHFVAERVRVHRPVIKVHVVFGVYPGEGMLHPFGVVAFRIVLSGMGATAFFAGQCSSH